MPKCSWELIEIINMMRRERWQAVNLEVTGLSEGNAGRFTKKKKGSGKQMAWTYSIGDIRNWRTLKYKFMKRNKTSQGVLLQSVWHTLGIIRRKWLTTPVKTGEHKKLCPLLLHHPQIFSNVSPLKFHPVSLFIELILSSGSLVRMKVENCIATRLMII